MYGIKNTKFVAAFAVLAMMLAGVGAVFVADGNDAVPVADKDLVIETNGAIALLETESVADFAPGVIMIKTTLKADLGGLSVVDYDLYNTYIKPYVSAGAATFPVDAFLADDPMFQNILGKSMVTTDDSNDFTKVVIKGQIVFDMDLAAEQKVVVADGAAAKALAKAIATAFNAVPAGYYSEGEVEAAVMVAVIAATEDLLTDDEAKEKYAGQVVEKEKIVEVEVVKEVTVKDDLYLYIAIAAIAAFIALLVLFMYFTVMKPKIAAKTEGTIEV